MAENDQYNRAWNGLLNSWKTNRLAHAYLIEGQPSGNALRFAKSFLKLLYCEADEKPCHNCLSCRKVANQTHPDLHWLEPQSKSRRITIDRKRYPENNLVDNVVQPLSRTAFEGGWKAAVVIAADRMNDSAQNMFLKTLEEPEQKTIFILLSNSPQMLKDTIVSRCQQIRLLGEQDYKSEFWCESLMKIMRDFLPHTQLDAAILAGRVDTLFRSLSDELAEEEEQKLPPGLEGQNRTQILDARVRSRSLEFRESFLRSMLFWMRDSLALISDSENAPLYFSEERETLLKQVAGLNIKDALYNLEVMDKLVRQLARISRRDKFVMEVAFSQLRA